MKRTKDPKKLLRKKCDKMLRVIILTSKPNCENCGQKTMDAHHFIPKSQCSKLRYNLKNLVSLCRSCHFKHHNGDPEIAHNIIQINGREWLDELLTIKHQPLENSYHTMVYYKSIEKKLSLMKNN